MSRGDKGPAMSLADCAGSPENTLLSIAVALSLLLWHLNCSQKKASLTGALLVKTQTADTPNQFFTSWFQFLWSWLKMTSVYLFVDQCKNEIICIIVILHGWRPSLPSSELKSEWKSRGWLLPPLYQLLSQAGMGRGRKLRLHELYNDQKP